MSPLGWTPAQASADSGLLSPEGPHATAMGAGPLPSSTWFLDSSFPHRCPSSPGLPRSLSTPPLCGQLLGHVPGSRDHCLRLGCSVGPIAAPWPCNPLLTPALDGFRSSGSPELSCPNPQGFLLPSRSDAPDATCLADHGVLPPPLAPALGTTLSLSTLHANWFCWATPQKGKG